MIVALLFHSDEKVRAAMSPAEMNALIESHVQYAFEVLGMHRVLDGRAFEMTTSAKTVEFPSGDPSVIEGPATRGAESLSGYYLIECADMDEAVALAERYPMPPGLGRIEVRPCIRSWDYAPSVESPASAASIWRLYSDITTWPRWKPVVERVELQGPFAAGTKGWLTPEGQSPMPFRIVAADVDRGYTSETDLGDGLLLTLDHRLVPLPDGGTRITHSVSMPRAALEKFGMNFSPNFNASVRATLDRLSDLAVAIQSGDGKLGQEADIRPETIVNGRSVTIG